MDSAKNTGKNSEANILFKKKILLKIDSEKNRYSEKNKDTGKKYSRKKKKIERGKNRDREKHMG